VITGLHATVYPVKDLEQAKTLFGSLFGVQPHTDTPYYVGYNVAGQEIALDPNGHSQGMNGSTTVWLVADIRQTLSDLIAAGATEQRPIGDVGGGNLLATVRDTDGNVIGLMQPA
jgi:predicted enzyme related to lactoylglutathione lyase